MLYREGNFNVGSFSRGTVFGKRGNNYFKLIGSRFYL